MSTILAKVKRLYNALEASLTLIANQWGYAVDTRRIVVMESDGVTKRYYYDSTRLADVTTSYGSALIGTPGITGVTPNGGTSGSTATLQNMLIGLKNYNYSDAGTAGYVPLFDGSPKTLINSKLSQSSNSILYINTLDNPVYLIVNNSSTGVDAKAILRISNNAVNAEIRMHSSGTGDYDSANKLEIKAIYGIMLSLGSSDSVKTYFGTPDSSNLFHTSSRKGVKQQNIALSTDADNTVGGHEQLVTITKGDANTRQFYINKFVTTINTPGNSNTTIDILHVDTVNTDVTGNTINLLNIKYGGSQRLTVNSAGDVTLKSGSKIFNGTGTPESAVTAPIGSMFLRSDGGAGTSLYIKESGVGNTGWVGK